MAQNDFGAIAPPRFSQTLGIHKMNKQELVVVGVFSNDMKHEIRLFLEMLGEEVVLSPGHSVELMARQSPDLLPLIIGCVDGGFQIHPHKEFDPDWHVCFKGKVIRAGHPTILSEYE